ncbi:SAM-dependent methyltransferase [Anabaenopsis elenkinii]|jgi:ribosomal protein L11 methylase PrmA|uniref:Class I SAM-dependent methyltransferase n=1 Tax=Anabaenopsis elenkinii CCIBt3563 TaxID=2779889 RepID=A0A7U3NMQ9_9CYAN|nr:methyltransferase domain-containing protein [Anabaenopsis elenkinii]QOV21788.1 class I SAM-dependent methyltransferase [Anabaenopsis elenkinii CCIBt3563]
MNYQKVLFLLATGVSLGFVGCTPPEPNVEAPSLTPTNTTTIQPREHSGDVPYVPTPQAVVDAMLSVAKVTKDDVLYDLGSGDGRIVITAAQKYGARGVGVEINPELIQEANTNAEQAGVGDRVKFVQQDLFKSDFSEATVVTLYLLPDINIKLRPQLFEQLKPGTRIVSHAFDMGEWEPEQTLKVDGRTIYYWVIPEEVPANLR